MKPETRNPKLNLFTGNRLEILADRLSEAIRTPLSSPLKPEIIIVQSRGMERWISMELACRFGICANIRYPFPNHFIQELFAAVIPDFPGNTYPGPQVMAWRIMEQISDLLQHASFQDIRRYLDGDETHLKRYQLSERIAYLFDQYLIYRPEMISDWETGKEDHWQAVLWRALIDGSGKVDQRTGHPAALYRLFMESVRELRNPPENFPERISVFGISTLPAFHLRILSAVSAFTEVNFCLMNPCREYWADIVSGREMKRIIRRSKKEAAGEELYLEKGNSLLASMGQLGRDFFSLLHDFECEEFESFLDPVESGKSDTILAAIQSDILNLRDRTERLGISGNDNSIHFHICHTPMREIEVLQDALLRMLDENPDLSPRDILVMTPNIETYAPFIQAVFSLPAEDPRRVPFSIADRGARWESPYIESFLNLLNFSESRFGASQVFGVLDSPAVRARFSLSEDDLEIIRYWIQDAGIRWGIDAESRRSAGVPAFSENTWKAGIDRMMLGYALTDNDRLFMDISPIAFASEGNFQALGNFVEFTDRLFAMASSLRQMRTLEEWGDFLKEVVDNFLSLDENSSGNSESWDLLLRRVLNGLKELQEASGFREKIPFSPVQYYLKEALETEGFGSGFLTGGVTFCAMLPMRSIPFKVICLIGMNDEDYPRQEQSLGFDLIARHPRRGDRSRRNDDRYLFLEALLSARERLYISYVGQSAQDNSIRPPSVLVCELLDYIEQGFRVSEGEVKGVLTTHHRLQAFHEAYFRSDSGTEENPLFSYSRENCEAARRIQTGESGPQPFITSPLAAPDGPERNAAPVLNQDWRTISLDDLCRFFAHPARYFLNKRLRIYLGEGEDALDENEPFDLEALEKYKIEQWLAAKGIHGVAPKELWSVVKASGKFPPGTTGEYIFNEVGIEVEDFVQKVLSCTEKGFSEPLDVDVQIGLFRITGRINDIRPDGLLYSRYAGIKAADRLRAWIYHLLANLACDSAPIGCTILCKDFEGEYAPVGEPARILQSLLDLYWKGLSYSMPFIPEISWTYADLRGKGKSEEEAFAAAMRKWQGNDFAKGAKRPKDDPYYALCFRDADPLNGNNSRAFCDLALEVFEPLRASLESGGSDS